VAPEQPRLAQRGIEARDFEELGFSLESGPQFFVIPMWAHEKFDIDTVDDMKEHWGLFVDPEDPTKGVFYNCIIGWQCGDINRVKMETYGLTEFYKIISPGSAGALEAALAGPQKRYEAR
jgi:ABC-type proline/glycine betaine transport system substrate-binding protein